ncbi:hypothetical protein KI387_031325, partial [Taxus chinensis]
MPPFNAAQVGSLATASHAILPTIHFRKLPYRSFVSSHHSSSKRITTTTILSSPVNNLMEGLLNKLGIRRAGAAVSNGDAAKTAGSSVAQGPDDDVPAPGQQFAQFGAGCFWGVELAFQRVPGVSKTEVGYSQGHLHNPTYEDVCSGRSIHSEVVRVQYNPTECSYGTLLDVFWDRHDPTTLNRQ